MSYMVKVLVMHHTFGESAHELVERHSAYDLKLLLVAQLGFIVTLVGLTYWRRGLDRGNFAADVPTSSYMRYMNCLNIVVAMSMSWLSLVFFNCLTMRMFPGISEEFDEIISAAALTVSAIGGIIALDLCADKVDEAAKEEAEKMSYIAQQNMMAGVAGKQALEVSTNLEKAIRTLISSFALAVGLSWEKAFHAALHTVIASNETMSQHYVISQALLALGNFILIAPVWLSFIVPMAKKTVQDHQTMMELSKRQE